MYRPEGWEEIVNSGRYKCAPRQAFEDGADAMLEGLKKTSIAEYGNVDYWDNDLNIKGALFSFGYLVFIPEEE